MPRPDGSGCGPGAGRRPSTSMPRLRKDRATVVDHVLVAAGEDARERLEDGHLAAQVAQHRGELAADRPAADHRHRRRAARRGPAPRRRSSPAPRRRRTRGWCGAPSRRPAPRRSRRSRWSSRRCPRPATLWSGSSVPLPLNTVTSRPFSRPASPLNSLSTTCCLRAWLTEKSTTGAMGWSVPAVTPNSSIRPRCGTPRRSRGTPWPGRSPRCRQVPPTLSSSTMATDRPAAAP